MSAAVPRHNNFFLLVMFTHTHTHVHLKFLQEFGSWVTPSSSSLFLLVPCVGIYCRWDSVRPDVLGHILGAEVGRSLVGWLPSWFRCSGLRWIQTFVPCWVTILLGKWNLELSEGQEDPTSPEAKFIQAFLSTLHYAQRNNQCCVFL